MSWVKSRGVCEETRPARTRGDIAYHSERPERQRQPVHSPNWQLLAPAGWPSDDLGSSDTRLKPFLSTACRTSSAPQTSNAFAVVALFVAVSARTALIGSPRERSHTTARTSKQKHLVGQSRI